MIKSKRPCASAGCWWLVCSACWGLLISSAVHAGVALNLSDMSSDETDPAMLSAVLEFEVLGDLLTLTVTNETTDPNPFDVSAIYFNASSEIEGLLLSQAPIGWDLLLNQRADGFGTFDFALIGKLGGSEMLIDPGSSSMFIFDILGSDPFQETYFTSDFSTIPPGSNPAIAAAKFVRGPGDDSAFGAMVPEPSTLSLLLIGSWWCIRRRA